MTKAFYENFLGEVRNQENGIRSGWDSHSKRWHPHDSYEGGSQTIAYGHKILSHENFSNGLTDEEAIRLFESDWKKAMNVAEMHFRNAGYNWNSGSLSLIAKLVAADIAFNTGNLETFPNFMSAMNTGDIDGMILHCTCKSLVERNHWRKQWLEQLKK